MKRVVLRTGFIMFLLLSLTGCMKMGPDYQTPKPPDEIPASFQNQAKSTGAYVENDRWWETFGDEKLNSLIDQALTRNWDLKRAAAKVLEVKAQFVQAKSDRFPKLNLNADAGKRQSVSGPGERRTESYNLSLGASYEVDLWGRLARAEEAAFADLLKAEEDRRTVAQGLVAEVISSYLSLEAQERKLGVTYRTVAAFEHSLRLVENRYQRGLTSVLDLRQARRILIQANGQIPALRLSIGLEQQKLAVLTGHYPKVEPARSQPDDYFPNLEPVPAGLPSELLKRRPDIRSQEANLNALSARVGQAEAARFPALRLTAGFGYSSNSLSQLITPESELWNLAAGLTQPIFDAGALESRQRAAEARLEQGKASYAKAVLTAFREVESSLLTRKEQMERRSSQKEALKEAKATEEAAMSRYMHGLSDYLSVLEAQRTRYEVETNLIDTELRILSNRVDLHLSLGGGWAGTGSAGGQAGK